ncbi:MAG: ATP-binding protein [Thermodesulfobacteriota bacterium]
MIIKRYNLSCREVKVFISIRYKLFATLLAAVIVVIVGMFFLVHWSFDRGFLNYVNTVEAKRLDSLAEHLQEAYADQGDWLFLQGNPRLWRQFLAASTPEGPQQFDPLEDEIIPREGRGRRHPGMGREMRQGRNLPRDLREEMKHLFEFRVVLMDADKNVVTGPRRFPADTKMVPLKHDSVAVGYLGHIPQKNLLAQHQLHFARQQKKAFAIISLLIAALAALLALPLAGRLVRRMKALASGTHHLAAGTYETRLEVGPADELGQLTQDFNSLALTLEKNEQGRRQWVADISHELRTPLAVLRGELEALQDGVRQPTPEAIRSLHSEMMRLSRLVDDLFQLSLSDIGALTYRKENVDVAAILNQAAKSFEAEFSERNIKLIIDIPAEREISLFGDPERLQQLFDNLFTNSLKYTDPDGSLNIDAQSAAGYTKIIFQDSGPSVSPAEIDKLFDRLYRVENSRNRATGGAGLGLAICRNIVEAHGGAITAEPSPLGGVLIRIKLPLGEQQ